MEFILRALRWLVDPHQWASGGISPLPLGDRVLEHLAYTGMSVGVAALIALPLGFYIGHTGRGRQFVIGFTGGMRALPTLGFLFFLTMVLGLGLSSTPAGLIGSIIALIVLAIPSILAGAYAGVESVSPDTVDAARAVGMTEMQILICVEIPLALPLIIGGIRAGVLQVVATATIASYAGLGGIGRVISSGIGLNDYDRILGGAFLVTALALLLDGVIALLQRLTRTPGTRPHRRSPARSTPRATAAPATLDLPQGAP